MTDEQKRFPCTSFLAVTVESDPSHKWLLDCVLPKNHDDDHEAADGVRKWKLGTSFK